MANYHLLLTVLHDECIRAFDVPTVHPPGSNYRDLFDCLAGQTSQDNQLHFEFIDVICERYGAVIFDCNEGALVGSYSVIDMDNL